MQVTTMIFSILSFLVLLGIGGTLNDIKNMVKPYLEARLAEMKIFYGDEKDGK